MEFINETIYNKKNLDLLTQVAGYTVKQRQTMRNRLICFLVGATGLILGITAPFQNGTITVLCQAYGIFFAFTGLFWFKVQCFPNYAAARIQEQRIMHFSDEGFSSLSAPNSTLFPYDQLICLVETPTTILLFIDAQNGLILEKSGFTQGDCTDFLHFIAKKTGLELQTM